MSRHLEVRHGSGEDLGAGQTQLSSKSWTVQPQASTHMDTELEVGKNAASVYKDELSLRPTIIDSISP